MGFLDRHHGVCALSISFPYFSGFLVSQGETTPAFVSQEGDVVEAIFVIDGMTCTGCEQHVNASLTASEGVIEVSSSFETGRAHVTFDQTRVSLDSLVEAVESETGYSVTESIMQ